MPFALLCLVLSLPATLDHAGRTYPLYPATTETCPDLPSPLDARGREYVIVELKDGTFGLIDVTRADHPEQVSADDEFPHLAATGLHDQAGLAFLTSLNGRPLADIDRDARPGALSADGFLAADESVRAVITGDDRLVRAMGLTHPDLARPLWHIWNLMQIDLDLGRWNMAHHRWENIRRMKYNGCWIFLDAHDTKGGQQSPFGDGLEGAFWMVFWRPVPVAEQEWLHERYGHHGPTGWNELLGRLTRIYTGEMEAFTITRYGFYEGHTDWRVDPLGAAWLFGLRSFPELEAAFPGELDRAVLEHWVEGTIR
ncbi:MAG: hypothetical protein IH621_06555 [Krumholzibacteria bacterium]|nr:hypothetical protein [Candidatus Krumholzibacteria bacterium]